MSAPDRKLLRSIRPTTGDLLKASLAAGALYTAAVLVGALLAYVAIIALAHITGLSNTQATLVIATMVATGTAATFIGLWARERRFK